MLRTVSGIAALSAIMLAGCSSAEPDSAEEQQPTTAAASSTVPSSSIAASSSAAPTTQSGGDTSTPEAAFVTGLRDATVPVRNDEGVIGTGQRMCDALADGSGLAAAILFGTEENPWSEDQARTAVTVAVVTLCPENADKVG